MSSFLGRGGGGGGGGMAIGDPVTGGTSKSVLYIDAGGNLAQNNLNLFYDDSTKTFDVGSTSTAGKIKVGAISGSGNPAGFVTITTPAGLDGGADWTMKLPGNPGSGAPITSQAALVTDGSGNTSWSFIFSSPAGSQGEIQLNDAGSLATYVGFSLDTTTHFLNIGVAGGGGGPLGVADPRYTIDTPTSGSTLDMTGYNPIFTEIVDPAGTLAALTIKLPNLAVNGQILRLKFSQIITSLTLTGNTGDSVKGAPTSAALGGYIDAQFTGTAGSGTWYC